MYLVSWTLKLFCVFIYLWNLTDKFPIYILLHYTVNYALIIYMNNITNLEYNINNVSLSLYCLKQ